MKSFILKWYHKLFTTKKLARELEQRVLKLENVWRSNEVHLDMEARWLSHIIIIGEAKSGPVVMIRQVQPDSIETFVRMAKQMSGGATLGYCDAEPGIGRLVNKMWKRDQ